MLLAQLELGGILDRDDPLVVGDERRDHVQRGGLARPSPARDEDVEPGLDAGLQELEHLRRRRSEVDQVVDRVRPRRELPDGDDGPDEGEGLDDRVDARAIGQAGVHPRARFVDPPAERGDDAVDDPEDVFVVQEDAVDAVDLAGPFDVDAGRPVDHDLGDGLVAQEGLQRPEAHQVVDHLLDEAQPLVTGDREGVLGHDAVDNRLDLGPDVGRRDVEQRVERADHLLLEAEANGAQQLLAGRDTGAGERDRGGRSRRSGVRIRGVGRLLSSLHALEQRHDRSLRDERGSRDPYGWSAYE